MNYYDEILTQQIDAPKATEANLTVNITLLHLYHDELSRYITWYLKYRWYLAFLQCCSRGPFPVPTSAPTDTPPVTRAGPLTQSCSPRRAS